MRRALQLVLLLLLATSVEAAIAFRAGTAGCNAAGAVASVTITVTTTAGDDVVVVAGSKVAAAPTVAVSSVTDTGGSNYAFRAGIDTGTGTVRGELWSCRNCAASTSITVNWASAPASSTACTSSYSGVAALGVTNTVDGATTTTHAISLTTQDNNNFIVAGMPVQGTGAETASVGTLEATVSGTNPTNGICDNTVATPASVTCTVTTAAGRSHALTALELRTVAPGGAAGFNKRRKLEKINP